MKGLFVTLLCASLSAQSLPFSIERDSNTSFQKLTLAGNAPPNSNHLLHFSHDAKTWFPVANSRALPWQYLDPDSRNLTSGFYRITQHSLAPISPHSSWKNTISLPDDSFRSDRVITNIAQNEIRYIKFSIILGNTPTVYFQDSSAYQFHYNFVTDRLDPFSGVSLNDFNATSLYPPNQEIALGALLFATSQREFALEFVGQESYPPEMLRYLYQVVDTAIERPDGWSGFYFPTFEQSESAVQNASYFESHDINLGSIARWQNADACYSYGWALGRLVFIPGAEIDNAFRSGTLLPTDILITDGVPAEIPYVAGIISTSPGTPNSHVAILARSYGIPFAYLSDDTDVNAALALAGKEVVFRASPQFSQTSGDCRIDFFETKDLSPDYRASILDLKSPPPLGLTPRENLGSLTMDLATAELSDISFIGGKASNFSLLRQNISHSSPPAIAFTFDLWDAYLLQSIDDTNLQTLITNRLASHTWPPNISALDADLKAIRDLIKDKADFSPAQQSAILAALQAAGFNPQQKLRFRSSTNVEDSEQFVGAGLYDSFSGCLQDDLDDDEEGPSHCDPTKESERGVFRAMRKVFASFYNLNAYLERLRRGVNESQVGMAILVHHSFPDETEAANGVVTGRYQVPGSKSFFYSKIVSQLGANSVTNPDGTSIPEVVESSFHKVNEIEYCRNLLQERSSLLPIGQTSVMEWEKDYCHLNSLTYHVAIGYHEATESSRSEEEFELEFEFKKLTDDSLVIKQVRKIPDSSFSGSSDPALINRPVTLEVFQGEAADLFSNHNLKLRLATESANRFIEQDTTTSLLTKSHWKHHSEGSIQEKTGPASEWHNADFSIQNFFGSNYSVDSWTETNFNGGRTDFELLFKIPTSTILNTQPIQTLGDFLTQFNATFSTPQLTKTHNRGFTTTTSQTVILTPSVTDQPLHPGSALQTRNHAFPSGIQLNINFYWPPAPTGIVAGYTAPLQKWDLTTITGLTTAPIQLRGYYSQTYRPGHHNFTEEFLFEPRLEEGISQDILDQLDALGIKQFYLEFGSLTPTFKAVGFDNKVRDLN